VVFAWPIASRWLWPGSVSRREGRIGWQAVARRWGWASPSQFTVAYQQRFGVPPNRTCGPEDGHGLLAATTLAVFPKPHPAPAL